MNRPLVPAVSGFRAGLEANVSNATDRAAMLKDIHLLEAALATDNIVVSRDDSARGLFSKTARVVHAISSTVWVNPAEEVDPRLWLDNGAEPDQERMLGRYGK